MRWTIEISPEMREGLRRLTRENLDAAVKDVLSPAQIKVVLEQRDLLLKPD